MTTWDTHAFILDGGPWHDYRCSGCSTQCDCESGFHFPEELTWDGIDGRYVRRGSSGASNGPFYEWVTGYTWQPD